MTEIRQPTRTYTFPIYDGRVVHVNIPIDLTSADVELLAEQIEVLKRSLERKRPIMEAAEEA